jgi:hypothetical protein
MKCGQCGGRAQLVLCTRCRGQLEGMLADLGWLLRELEVTATRQDRLSVGKSRRTGHSSPANMGAIELRRSIAGELQQISGLKADPRLLVWMLRRDVDRIVTRPDAAAVYRRISRMVGFARPGPLHDAINRPDVRFAGECADCGELCYSRHEDTYVTCPGCGLPVDVERNRTRTVIEYDLLPERALLSILDNLNEHVPRVTLYAWIKAGRLPAAGYLSRTGVVAHKGGPRDPRVYSLDRARALRRRTLACP